jgi:ParB-like chromosome segregation protein Spo0J
VTSNSLTRQVEIWPIDKLVPYARNPRKNDAAVDRMAASIQEFGFKIPVLARSTGEVVDGHLRLKAARKLGISEIPVILCDEWADAQVKAFRLMVNRSVAWAEWDSDLVGLELLDLKNLDYDLDLTGFDDKELAQLLAAQEATDGLCDEDAAPPVSGKPISKAGDLWLLGHHRLLCGDSTDQHSVSHLLGNVKPTLLVTDQPYGVQYDPEWRKRAGVNNSNRMGKVRNDDRADWREAWALFPGDVVYVWHGALHASTVADSLASCDFEIRSQIVWAKPSLVMERCLQEIARSKWSYSRAIRM